MFNLKENKPKITLKLSVNVQLERKTNQSCTKNIFKC